MADNFKFYDHLNNDKNLHSLLIDNMLSNSKISEDINICINNTIEMMKSGDQTLNFSEWKSKINPNDVNYKLPFCSGNNYNCKSEEVSSNDIRNLISGNQFVYNNDANDFNLITTENKELYDESNNISVVKKNVEEVPSALIKNQEFKTAYEIYENQCQKKYERSGVLQKSLGTRRRGKAEFVPPFKDPPVQKQPETVIAQDERLRNIDEKMIELINNEIMHKFKPIDWNDIAGLQFAKSLIQEAVVWPILRPDLFTGLRRPPRGILLFGPPGTGKTLIGKCIASKSQSTFFSISASSLTSKWIGEGEKMVRALFAVAAIKQPSVVFIDEIDSLLSQRNETEHESSRRLKTEFLVQLDGAATLEEDRILIVGATNRPQELDEAARRRLVRRLYIPLPDHEARVQIIKNLLRHVRKELTENDYNQIGKMADGYSGADMEFLCREASMEPIRVIPVADIQFFDENNVRPINMNDFQSALIRVRPSVSKGDLEQYEKWDNLFGSGH